MFTGTYPWQKYYVQALKTTGQNTTTELTPIMVRILQEVLRSAEGSFDWTVIAEPTVKPSFQDFLDKWDEADKAPTVVIKCPKVKNGKGKGREETAPYVRSTRVLKRKLEEEEEISLEEALKEEEEEPEDEETRNEGGRKKRGRTSKWARIKSAAEVHSEDEGDGPANTINQRLPHPDGICDSCSSVNAACELSGPGRTACDRSQARKEKCSLSRARESKKGESSKKVRPKKTVKDVAAGKPPSKGAKATGSHLLADKMTVFSNPHLKGASPIPPKSIGQLVEMAGESEPIIRVMRSQVDVDAQANRRSSESVQQGSVHPGHDQEIPSKPFLSFLGTGLT